MLAYARERLLDYKLDYNPVRGFVRSEKHPDFIGASGGTRTPNLLIRSQKLYPIELRMRPLIVEHPRRTGKKL